MANQILLVAVGITFLATVLASFRLIIGKTIVDRAIAMDVLTIITISLLAYIAVHAGRIIYLDVAMVYALISFIGVIALARYVEGGL